MMFLLDANVLIASVFPEHEHHSTVQPWWQRLDDDRFATNSIVEGALIRYAVRTGLSAAEAQQSLSSVQAHPAWTYLAATPSYTDVDLTRVLGHRQVTDQYLAACARLANARVVTLDAAFAASSPDVVQLIQPSDR